MAATPSDPVESLDEVRAGVLRRPGLLSVALRDALSDAYDGWLRALLPGRLSGVALVAVGGLGRREPMPFSDLDLVLLHDGTYPGLAELADSIWYPVWDSKVSLDHSVRTVDQAIDVARDDVKALQGLLDARFVGGDERLAGVLRTRAVELWRATAVKRAAELREISERRWQVAGEGAFLLEPHLKDSRGGLRDVQTLRTFALAQLVDLPPIVRSANTLLLDVRAELQRSTGRAEDVLYQQEQDGIAVAFGLVDVDGEPDRDELLRRVNHCARVVAHALELSWRRIDIGAARRPFLRRLLGSGGNEPVREGIARDVVAQAGEVVLSRDADPRADPGLVLRAARAAARTNYRSRRTPSTGWSRSPPRSASRGRPSRATTSSRCSAPGRRRCRCSNPSIWQGFWLRSSRNGTPFAVARNAIPCTGSRSTGTCWRQRHMPPSTPVTWRVRTCCWWARCCTTSARAIPATIRWSVPNTPNGSRPAWASRPRTSQRSPRSPGIICCCRTPRRAATSTTR